MMTVISALIKCTIAGSVIVLAVLLLRAIFHSGLPKRFVVFLWLFSFAAFLVPVSIPLPPALSGVYSEIIPQAASTMQNTNIRSSAVSGAVTPARPKTDKQSLRPIQAERNNSKVHPVVARSIRGTTPTSDQIIFILYLCISAALAILFTALYLRTMRRFRKPVILRSEEQPRALQRTAGIRRKVLFGLSDQTNVPVAAGLFRPKVILPDDFDLEKEALASHILLHELIHIKHHDSAVNLITLYIVCLHWFNPFAWLAWFLLGRDMEFACDSAAVRLLGYKNRSEYAQSLLLMAAKKKKVQPYLVPALGKYGVKERVTNVMRTKKLNLRILAACFLSILLVGTSFTAVSCTKASPAAQTAQKTMGAMPKMMKRMLSMPKQKLADNFSGLDLCLGESLYFTDSKNISSETLFTYFSYIVGQGDSFIYPRDYDKRWFSQKDQQYHVPVADIVKVLNRYFVAVKFDPTKILGYNKKTEKIDRLVDGFGGGRLPRMAAIKRISRDTLKITVNYMNMDDSKKIEYSVTYTVLYNDTGYKYRSIVEN